MPGSGYPGLLYPGEYYPQLELFATLTLSETLPWEARGVIVLTLSETLPIESLGFAPALIFGNYLGGGTGLRTRPHQRRVCVRIKGRTICRFTPAPFAPSRRLRKPRKRKRVESVAPVQGELIPSYRVYSEARSPSIAGLTKISWQPLNGILREDDDVILSYFLTHR